MFSRIMQWFKSRFRPVLPVLQGHPRADFTAYHEIFVTGRRWQVRIYDYAGGGVLEHAVGEERNAAQVKDAAQQCAARLMQKYRR